jgi:hypothetical protein
MPHRSSPAPAAKGQRAKGKRRSKRRTANKSPAIAVVSSSLNPSTFEPWMPIFPASTTRWLRYATTCNVTATSGLPSTPYIFRANDLFDPDFSGTGHQPMGFDQMMSFYNHFVVIRSRMTVICRNTSAGVATAFLRVDGDSTALTSIDRIVEFGGVVTECLEAKGTSASMRKIGVSADIMKLQGVTRSAITSDPSLQGNAAASPVELTYYHLGMFDNSGTTVTGLFDVVIEYQAVFLEPRDLALSLRKTASAPCESKTVPSKSWF